MLYFTSSYEEEQNMEAVEGVIDPVQDELSR
jgi:hypothetical protein